MRKESFPAAKGQVSQSHKAVVGKERALYRILKKSVYNMRRTIILLAALCLIFACSLAQPHRNTAYEQYISQYKDLAISQMMRYKIPASITLAQGLLESAAGRSDLARKGNNHFGIKCHGWTGRTTYHDDDTRQECFRAYDNAWDSYEDHSRFLARQSRYSRLFSLPLTDYKGWARGLKECGYATNPRYADNLIRIIEQYQLYKFDTAKTYDKFIARHNSTDRPGGKSTELHHIYLYNKNYYMVAREGDTFQSIAEEIGISDKKLAKYNERGRKEKLQRGDIIYLKKKRSKADRKYKNTPHVVKAGESMYSISQRYGIRLNSLYKKNGLPNDYMPQVGDTLKVY